MLVIGALTWRTMETHDACFLIHTASLGIMIVFGVLPRRQAVDESVTGTLLDRAAYVCKRRSGCGNVPGLD